MKELSTKKWEFPLGKKNFIVIGIGIAVILLGYLMMSLSVTTPESWNNPIAVNVAPVVLILGYCVIIPYGILLKEKDEQKV